MGRYNLLFRKSVTKDLREIPAAEVHKILAAIRDLSVELRPIGSERLSGQENYRIRRGDYRIIYEIHDDPVVVIVVKVGPRREVYR